MSGGGHSRLLPRKEVVAAARMVMGEGALHVSARLDTTAMGAVPVEAFHCPHTSSKMGAAVVAVVVVAGGAIAIRRVFVPLQAARLSREVRAVGRERYSMVGGPAD